MSSTDAGKAFGGAGGSQERNENCKPLVELVDPKGGMKIVNTCAHFFFFFSFLSNFLPIVCISKLIILFR